MSLSLYIPINESPKELQKALRKSIPLLQPRIKMLIEMSKAGSDGISRRELMNKLGVSSKSIQKWRSCYKEFGLSRLLTHKRTGFKPKSFTEDEHKAIEKKLNEPKDILKGYKELHEWVEFEFGKKILYNTLLKYSINILTQNQN
jgi:transposase